jgi:shikimate kinase
VGLPGSGKSTIGRQLSRKLAIPCADSDVVIEKRLGCSVREFFEREGEEKFRDIESDVIEQLTSATVPTIVSTGGGSILRATNRAFLRERGQVIYLHSSPEEVYRRLRHDQNRPLLQVSDPMGRLRELYLGRDPLYRQTAHRVFETGRPSVTVLVNAIVEYLQSSNALPRLFDAATPGAPLEMQ